MRDMSQSPGCRDAIFQWLKLALLALVQVHGSIENERIFSAMTYLVCKYRNVGLPWSTAGGQLQTAGSFRRDANKDAVQRPWAGHGDRSGGRMYTRTGGRCRVVNLQVPNSCTVRMAPCVWYSACGTLHACMRARPDLSHAARSLRTWKCPHQGCCPCRGQGPLPGPGPRGLPMGSLLGTPPVRRRKHLGAVNLTTF